MRSRAQAGYVARTRFLLNDSVAEPGTRTLDFLRRELRLCGTKEGCREGECGACTILVGRPEAGGMRYRTAVSCLVPLAQAAYAGRVSLSEHAHYATPGLWFDRAAGKGSPFAYHVYGTGVVEVTLDCLRGTYSVGSVRCVHDVGESLAPDVDRAQIEGGIVQGLLFDATGRLSTGTASTYKVPDSGFAPPVVEVRLLEGVHGGRSRLQGRGRAAVHVRDRGLVRACRRHGQLPQGLRAGVLDSPDSGARSPARRLTPRGAEDSIRP